MLAFIAENAGTILVSAALLALVGWIIYKLVKDKKSGKSAGCGGGCSGCPSSSACHKQ